MQFMLNAPFLRLFSPILSMAPQFVHSAIQDYIDATWRRRSGRFHSQIGWTKRATFMDKTHTMAVTSSWTQWHDQPHSLENEPSRRRRQRESTTARDATQRLPGIGDRTTRTSGHYHQHADDDRQGRKIIITGHYGDRNSAVKKKSKWGSWKVA